MTITLAITTAIVLMQLARFVASPEPLITPPIINRAVIDRFYDAINTTIATGDVATLNDLVAPNLSLLNGDRRIETGRSGLIEHLLSLRRSQPTLRLAVRDLVADARTAIVQVDIEGASEESLLATPFGADVGQVTDRLTIADGQIAELHGVVWNLTPAILLAQTAIQRPAPEVQIGMTRMTLDGSTAPFALSALGPIVIVVESGSIKVKGGTTGIWSRLSDGTMGAASKIDVGVTRELFPGDQFVSPKGSPFILLNDSQTPALVLVVAVIPLDEWLRGTSGNNLTMQRSTIIVMMTVNDDTLSKPNVELPPGVHASRLAVQLASMNEGEQRLRLQRLDLLPSTEVMMHSHTATRLIARDHHAAGLVILRQRENGQNSVTSVLGADTHVFAQPLAQITAHNLDDHTGTLLILSWQ